MQEELSKTWNMDESKHNYSKEYDLTDYKSDI
jgi:hypothetical protein